ncbi:MAG: hypothetical protein A2571_01820 [Candidatus Vogelbacteria bacterium RIFOXYD1_FULL_44_32]|uniref:Cell division protein FtsL n=1 Tax=Candidatus Vogelbacteria bacterium RIFOXYD1_FULL_44_32 TaxID=1802438 RepID=A0A1G2QD34_9BACT|nr:MAG: hypothetical protein A2571_01820 [Candidatus Vogelbacteria bacterium RIFOXYD1_FULL_44_32]
MKDFQGQRRVRKMIYSKISLVVLGLLILFMVKALWGVQTKNSLAVAGRTQAEAELAELEAQKAELSAQVGWLGKDRGQEEALRQNFSVTLPGEKMVIVVEDASRPTTTTPKKSGGWWQAGWQALADIFS